MEKITIKDVARLADVSVATVSYIVNGIHEDRYTPDTKRKVLQIVNLYNYQPSRLAQSFALSKSRNVIILTDKHQSILQKAESYDFLRLFCKAFERLGYNPIIQTHLENTRIDMADAITAVGLKRINSASLRRKISCRSYPWTERLTTSFSFRYIRTSDTFLTKEKKSSARAISRWFSSICTTAL